MFKRIFSFIVILLAVSLLVFVLFAYDMFSGFAGTQRQNTFIEHTYAVDRSGNIYFVRSEQGMSFLVSLDSTGRQSFKKDISEVVGENCVVDNIYVEEDKGLLLTAYRLISNTSEMSQVAIYMFREDGSFVSQVFKNDINRYYDSKYRVITAMSDDGRNIYFGFLNGPSIDIFSYAKDNSEPPKKVESYNVSEQLDKIIAAYTLPSKDLVLSLEGGQLLRKSATNGDISFNFGGNKKVIIDTFWHADNQYYCRDAVSGDIYMSSPDKLELSPAIRGSKVISDSDGITFKQMDELAVGRTGNVMGIVNNGDTNRIFLGGFAFLPEIGRVQASSTTDLTLWFLLIGIIAGVIIVSLLLWDFYCNILHMRLSILFRQAFLVILVIFLALYILTQQIIVPQSEQMLDKVYVTDHIKTGQMFLSALKSAAGDQGGRELDIVRCDTFFDSFRKNFTQSLEATAFLLDTTSDSRSNRGIKGEMLNKPHIFLIVKEDSQYTVAASSNRYEKGYPAALLGYGRDFSDNISKAENNNIVSFNTISQRGKELCVLLPTELTFYGAPVVFGMTVGLDVLTENSTGMTSAVVWFMRLIGILLVLLVMVVEYYTAYNVRRLKKSVDKIASGDYGREINVHSGDEIEDLGKAINALSKNIQSTTNSLNRLNASYHRFVPQRFLEILGETHIEGVGKKSQAYKENVVMMFIRFKFLSSMGEKSKEIFSNINSVFENIVPVVNENKGTVYNFLANGFNAVFETEPEDVLRVALRIREVLGALNKEKKQKGLGEVDLRVFITIGNIMLGFIGDEKRMEPAAISDAAKKAEPIEQICFDSEVYIACTRDIVESLPKGVYRNRRIGEVMISGERMELFDLYDSDPYSLIKTKEIHADRFELGVNLFAKGDYANALNVFMDIIKYSSQDGVSRNYMYLAEHNLHSSEKQHIYTTINELERTR